MLHDKHSSELRAVAEVISVHLVFPRSATLCFYSTRAAGYSRPTAPYVSWVLGLCNGTVIVITVGAI